VCHDVNFNANSTKRSSTPGLNDNFRELLTEIELKKIFIEPFKLQMKKIFHHLNTETIFLIAENKRTLKELEEKLQKLEEKYLFEDLKKETYDKYKNNLESEILKFSQNIEEMESKLSNHSDFIDKAIDVSENLSKYWGSGNSSTKERIQKTVFPKGLVIDTKKRIYRTKDMNPIFNITKGLSDNYDSGEIEKVSISTDLSFKVAGVGTPPIF
jgi:superfamily I DNA/RNA helicase